MSPPPPDFSFLCCLTHVGLGKVDTGKRVTGASPLTHNRTNAHIEAATGIENVCLEKRVSCFCVLLCIMNNKCGLTWSPWLQPHNPHPDKALLPPPPVSVKNLLSDIMCRSNYAPNRTFQEGQDHFWGEIL